MSDAYCTSCFEANVRTPVEKYRGEELELCTLHYWLMRGRKQGFTLEAYAMSSSNHNFVVSLPREISKDDRAAPVYREHHWPRYLTPGLRE